MILSVAMVMILLKLIHREIQFLQQMIQVIMGVTLPGVFWRIHFLFHYHGLMPVMRLVCRNAFRLRLMDRAMRMFPRRIYGINLQGLIRIID